MKVYGVPVLAIILAMVIQTNSFNLQISEDFITVSHGQQFLLSCQADSSYEFCKFRSPGGQFCDFEWKRSVWNVTQADCAGLEDRVTFAGSYEDHECALIVDGAAESDQGLWTCEVESYVLGGGRGSGSLRIGEFNVVIPATTITTTTTTTTPTTSFNRSPRKLDLDLVYHDNHADTDPLPNTTRQDLLLEKATIPVALSLVVIVVIISIIAILVIVHKMKNGSVSKVINLEAGQANTSFEEPKQEKDEKVMEEVLFMKKVFPHIMNFPSEEEPSKLSYSTFGHNL